MDSLIDRINNADKWPNIEMPENLDLLNELADNEYESGTFSGMLAGLLMYHQIVEAMCIHLLEDCNFLIQLALYPTTINLSIESNKTLGHYIKALRETIDFKEKEHFISIVEAFNKLRNDVVHKMRRSNVKEQMNKLATRKEIFDRLFELYDDIQDDFRVIFHDYKKDVFIDYTDDNEFD